ncbi:MAG TPA: MarR family winged helix-turn-helix transcriptional regulator [Polyangiaceae bacterium]|nr:MarR family winged helix-turn-helix transcriptional regulator [Polyangiaceae bacterium]
MTRPDLDLDEFLPYRLSVAANAVSRAIALSYERPFGLKVHEWRLLAVLAEGGELTQQAIVGRTQMDKVAVSRAARSLERRRLVRRAPDAEDGRSLRLSLTAEGRRVHARVAPAALAIEAEVLGALDGRELEALKGMLRKLERAAARALSCAEGPAETPDAR